MKEDAQLICPLAYEDPHGAWDLLNKELSPHFPLFDITWKSPQGSTIQVTIDKLSVRCIPSGANLFKDTDHPFRWFLAPYVNIYLFVCDSADSYKSHKTKLKQWIDTLSGPKRSSWLVVYLPMGNQVHETYQKIFTKLSNEIYFDKAGDRTAAVYCNASHSSRKAHVAEVVKNIKEGIITSFYQRCSLYDSEIRRLDAMRGTAQLDFRQLFLVKESLALMFQMMQLPSEALLQYEELENLLVFAPVESLPLTEWPFVPFETSSSGHKNSRKNSIGRSSSLPFESGKSPSATTSASASASAEEGGVGSEIEVGRDSDVVPVWMCVCQQGVSLLRYSINHARMKVLKNQIGLLELQHYVFSRICFFLFSLSRPAICAEKAFSFLKSIRIKIQNKFDAIEEKKLMENGEVTPHRRSVSLEQLNVIMLDGKDSLEGKEGFDNLNGVSMSVQQSNMADLWLIVSVVQVTKKCREVLLSSLTSLQNETSNEKIISTSPLSSKKELDRADSTESSDSAVMMASEGGKKNTNTPAATSSFFNDETVGIKSKALSRHLMELLTLARRKLLNLIYDGQRYRSISLEMAQLFIRWDDLDAVAAKFPTSFTGRNDNQESSDHSHCHPRGNMEETISAFQKKIQTLMQYHSEFTQEELHSKSKLLSENKEPSRGASGGLFVSNKEILDLEADVSVILLRLLIENEEICCRWRFACHSMLECADILLTNGNFLLAKTYLRAALDGVIVSPDAAMTRNLTPQLTGTLTLWGQLRVWTLRKLLLCYRALDDGHNFLAVSLSLLDPALHSFVSLDCRKSLQSNVMMVKAQTPIVTDIQYHFKLQVQLTTPSPDNIEGNHALCPPMIMTKNATKHIHDESYRINIASCIAGEAQCIYLNITHNFPEALVAEAVNIMYTPFVPVAVHGLQTEHSSMTPPLIPEEHSATGNKTFVCVPFPEYYNSDQMITLQSGVTIIGMQFTPPCCGEFAPSEITIKLNSAVTFVQTIVSDLNQLHPFFNQNMLIDVVSPKKALQIEPFPSTFTPIGHADLGGIFIVPESTDTVQSICIQAHCVSKKDRAAYNTEERSRKDSISLVSERISTLSTVGGFTDSVSQHESHLSIPSFQHVALDAPNTWVFQCEANESDTESHGKPTVVVQKGALLITDIPQNMMAKLKVPFQTQQLDEYDFHHSEVEEYDIIYSVEGKLIRNGCAMDFEFQVEQSISVGQAFNISQESTELFGNEYFSQCVLRNISAIPWQVHQFVASPISSAAPPSAFALVEELAICEADKDNESQWKEVSTNAKSFILYPGEYFNVAMHLKRIYDESTVDSVAVSYLTGIFPIQRCHNINSDNETQETERAHLATSVYELYNNTIFNHTIAVCPPLISPLVYSLDYQLRAFVSPNATTTTTPATEELSMRTLGEAIPVTYELDVIFPSASATLETVILVLSFACTQDWAVLGKTTSVVHCSSQQDTGCVSLDINLVAVSAGMLLLPPLKVTVFQNDTQLHASLRQTAEDREPSSSLDISPEAPSLHIVPGQRTASIFTLVA